MKSHAKPQRRKEKTDFHSRAVSGIAATKQKENHLHKKATKAAKKLLSKNFKPTVLYLLLYLCDLRGLVVNYSVFVIFCEICVLLRLFRLSVFSLRLCELCVRSRFDGWPGAFTQNARLSPTRPTTLDVPARNQIVFRRRIDQPIGQL